MTTPIEGLQRRRDGFAVEIREAQAVAVRMVVARNALRAKVIQARADVATPSAHDRETRLAARARLARARHQYEVVRNGAQEALHDLAVVKAHYCPGSAPRPLA